eukprot:CCRYP_006589-RA/>CCRYP_006589-RA protein AED:0.05 eAED:0.05 QI:76/0.88/0.8/1/0.77/0.9/10/0/1153
MLRSMHSLVFLFHSATFVFGRAHHHDLYFQPDNATPELLAPDVFDSCIVVCYDDILRRFGSDLAEHLKTGGFTFASCQGEQDHYHVTSTFGGRSDEDKQQALNRILGATSQLNKLWKTRGSDGKLNIPYTISTTSAFTQETITTIESALSYLQDSAGIITFIPRTTENEFIYFTYEPYFESICASNIGRQTNTSTNIYLGYCRSFQHKMIIVHELVHALGFWHEHTRPDRDDYISIQWDNVQADFEHNFAKAVEINSLGSPYDFGSIMHFSNWAYANNPTLPTIVNKTIMGQGVVMGQREKLSDADVYQIRLLYQCESGPRSGPISIKDLCSEDCKCWEYAPGECVDDNECLGDLICAETPVKLTEQDTFNFLSFSSKDLVLPSKMCMSTPVNSISPSLRPSAKPSYVLSHTTPPANNPSSKPTNPPTLLPVVWYIDWNLARCVQDCVGGWTCGGYKPAWVKAYYSLEMCCSMISWKSFEDCAPLAPRPTKEPTPKPSSQPSLRPSKQPTSKPSQNPTSNPTFRKTSSPTSSPTNKPTHFPTKSPSLSPTKLELPFNVFTQDLFDAVAPNAIPPYTYSGLLKAVSLYNTKNPGAGIFNQGSEMNQRQELAAFLTNAMHASNDFQATRDYLACGDSIEADGEVFCKPCSSADFNTTMKSCRKSLVSNDLSYGLFCNAALSPTSNPDGCSCSAQFEDSAHPGYINANKLYFGRGSGILSWNYNYIDASVAITGSKETFCANPDLLATNEVYVWSAGLWLWMEVTNGVGKTSHQIIFDDGNFGGTINNVNGASECPAVRSVSIAAVKARLNRYCRMTSLLQVDALLDLDGCTGLDERLSECLVDGSCPYCNEWQIGSAFSTFTKDSFDAVAPNAIPPYTYSGLIKAVSLYNTKNPGAGIFNQGSEMNQRQELAAFLANAMHASNDFHAARNYLACGDSIEADGEVFCKPCSSADFNTTMKSCRKSLVSNDLSYGLFCNAALSPTSNPDGCSCSAQFEDSAHPGYINANKLYFGRGSGILSWNYNYIDASVAITGSKETFCANPDLLATNEVYVWSAGLWLWMEVTNGVGKTSHQIIFDDGNFGGTVNNVNGASECPAVRSVSIAAVKARLNRYCRMTSLLQVDALLNLDGCTGLDERLSECLVDGSCPYCNALGVA